MNTFLPQKEFQEKCQHCRFCAVSHICFSRLVDKYQLVFYDSWLDSFQFSRTKLYTNVFQTSHCNIPTIIFWCIFSLKHFYFLHVVKRVYQNEFLLSSTSLVQKIACSSKLALYTNSLLIGVVSTLWFKIMQSYQNNVCVKLLEDKYQFVQNGNQEPVNCP